MDTESNVGEVQGEISDGGGAPGHNPAWDEVLGLIPESLHGAITPHFQKWDSAAQTRIESVNESMKQFDAYKPFVEHGIDPSELEQGLRLMFEINNNPRNVYDALAKAYNYEVKAAIESSGEDEETQLTDDPRFGKLQEGIELVSKIVLADQQAKQDAAADIQLDRELKSLTDKYGAYDEDFVLAKMQNGYTGEQAVEAFMQLKAQFQQSQPFAPNILGGGSPGAGLPSNAIDPTKLSSKDTRNLVAEMLAAAAKQNH